MSSVTTPPDTTPAPPAPETATGRMRPIKGPSALGSDPQRFWHLTRTLAVTEFKLRFFGSALGYLWQLMRPLMLFGILYVLFSRVLSLDKAPFYAEALLLGLVMYTFFSDATKGSVGSLVVRESLVRKIEFPRLAVPLAVVLNALFNLALNLMPVLVFLLVDGGAVRLQWLEFPVLVALLVVLATGLAMLLSSLYVRYRDIEPIWDVVLSLMFYGSPIFYTVSTIAEKEPKLAQLLMLNPFAAILQQSRYAIFGAGHPSAAQAIGGTLRLAAPLGVAIVILVVGWIVFSRRAPRIAEEL
ncbi:MAG: type transport system permease protein [Solirubrobacteraceae bacterium]|jgi:ABC-2 type transport system permease protein|nr:type transport system permease protein [Solirubrobacteraceae bacterium]MEA2394404.1 type transport system permease protein [Solirubrobacteraceae bacterium]